MSVEEKRVQEFAYQIWESEGRPEGQEARHWEMARKLAAAETENASAPAKRTRNVTKPEAAPATAAEQPAAAKKARAPRATTTKEPKVKEPKAPRAPKVPRAPKA